MVSSYMIFAVGDPLPNLLGWTAEYLFWHYGHNHILQDVVLLGFLENVVHFCFK